MTAARPAKHGQSGDIPALWPTSGRFQQAYHWALPTPLDLSRSPCPTRSKEGRPERRSEEHDRRRQDDPQEPVARPRCRRRCEARDHSPLKAPRSLCIPEVGGDLRAPSELLAVCVFDGERNSPVAYLPVRLRQLVKEEAGVDRTGDPHEWSALRAAVLESNRDSSGTVDQGVALEEHMHVRRARHRLRVPRGRPSDHQRRVEGRPPIAIASTRRTEAAVPRWGDPERFPPIAGHRELDRHARLAGDHARGRAWEPRPGS
jgi:hypothetical protein